MKMPLEHYLRGGYVIEVLREEGPKGETFVARYRAMPNCLGQGSNEREAVDSLQAVRDAYITSRFKREVEIPDPDFDTEVVASVSTSMTVGGTADEWDTKGFRIVSGDLGLRTRRVEYAS